MMKSDKMRLEISRSLKVIKRDFFEIKEDVEIHIPLNVEEIEEDAFVFEDDSPSYNVDIYYDGNLDQWNHLRKGLIEEKTTEDWYGYYYHNGPRYETSRLYYSWFKNYYKGNVVIHCVDGETKPDSGVDRKHPYKEIK